MEENAKILCDFGLTLNQAKVYVTIVKLGSAQVGEISSYSKIRREDVYRSLPKLEEMGLIEKSLGAPVKIRALPLEDALGLLIKHQQDEASQKMSKMNASAEEFLKRLRKGQQQPTPGETPLFSLIPEKEPVSIKTATLIQNSKKQIDIIAARKNLAHLLHLNSDLFKRAARSGVTTRIVTERTNEEDSLQKLVRENISPSREVIDLRYVDSLPGQYIIFDAKEALITTSTETGLIESSSLYTRNSGLVEVLQKSFGDIWFFASMPRQTMRSDLPTAKTRKSK